AISREMSGHKFERAESLGMTSATWRARAKAASSSPFPESRMISGIAVSRAQRERALRRRLQFKSRAKPTAATTAAMATTGFRIDRATGTAGFDATGSG